MTDAAHVVLHVEARPSWACVACNRPWPCDQARAALTAEMEVTALRVHMWLRLEAAAGELPATTAAELFDRFLRWTG
jgi:hypothetical protein